MSESSSSHSFERAVSVSGRRFPRMHFRGALEDMVAALMNTPSIAAVIDGAKGGVHITINVVADPEATPT